MNIWNFERCEAILEELRPKISSATWGLRLARWASKRSRRTSRRAESFLKRAFKKTPYFVFEVEGLKVVGDWRDRYSRTILWSPGYEASTAGYILSSLKSYPGAYIDAGTNMAVLASLVARGTQDTVLGIEPDEETAKRAAAAFALNGFRQAKMLHAAVGDHNGKVTFYVTPGRSDAASLSGTTVGEGAIEVEVEVCTLDSIADALNEKIGFIKVDVEGYEPQAFDGAPRVLAQDRPNLFFEYHWDIAPKLGWTADDVRAKIDRAGAYKYNVLHDDDPVRDYPPTRDMGLALNIWAQRI